MSLKVQGSVMGPLLFILYSTPLSNMITNHMDLQHHLYADDTQVDTCFKTTSNFSSWMFFILNIQQYLLSVQYWMYTNKVIT